MNDTRPTPEEVAETAYQQHRLRFGPLTVMVGICILATFGVWAYAYSGRADRSPPDVLNDPSFAATAETRCAKTVAEMAIFPNPASVETARQRSDQLVDTTLLLEAMIDDLEAEPAAPTESRDAQLRENWIDNWRTLLGDRYDYADRLAVDEDARFLVTDIGVGEKLERRILRFATVNEMPACGPPTDVG